MTHWLFFSYARENLYRGEREELQLRKFCEDLKVELEENHYFGGNPDERPMFWDRDSLQLMSSWRAELKNALQSSRVLACAVSPAYVKKQFCGKEYWLFDRRRQEAAHGGNLPKTILPIIWIPVGDEMPAAIASEQFDHGDLPDEYREYGLRDLMKGRKLGLYRRCLTIFARAIIEAAQRYTSIPPLPDVPEFEQMPSAFEPVGPSRARFAFIAGERRTFAGTTREDRYSVRGKYWRPFNPPQPHTVEEIAEGVAIEQRMSYEELLADERLTARLGESSTQDRVIFVVDPWTIRLREYQTRVPPPDVLERRGVSVIMPLNANEITNDERAEIDGALATAFPRLGSGAGTRFSEAPSFNEFRAVVERELSASHLSAISAAADEKPVTDNLPVVSSKPAQRG